MIKNFNITYKYLSLFSIKNNNDKKEKQLKNKIVKFLNNNANIIKVCAYFK